MRRAQHVHRAFRESGADRFPPHEPHTVSADQPHAATEPYLAVLTPAQWRKCWPATDPRIRSRTRAGIRRGGFRRWPLQRDAGTHPELQRPLSGQPRPPSVREWSSSSRVLHRAGCPVYNARQGRFSQKRRNQNCNCPPNFTSRPPNTAVGRSQAEPYVPFTERIVFALKTL
jgi:hypothetical protein